MPEAGGLNFDFQEGEFSARAASPTTALIPMLYADDIGQRIGQLRKHQLDAYLVKPITRRGLFRAIARKLGTRTIDVSPHDRLGKLAGGSVLPRTGPKARILVAEDSTDSRFLIEAYLRTEPCTLTFAQDGEEAVEKATSNDYDLISHGMFRCPKRTASRRERREIRKWETEQGRKPVPILALTASAFEEDIEQLAQGWLHRAHQQAGYASDGSSKPSAIF